MRCVLVLLALLLPARVRAAEVAGRESVAEVGALLHGLRTPAPQPAVSDGAAVRLYVLVSALTPERRAALETAGLVIEVPAPGSAAPRWREGEVVQGTATAGAQRSIAHLPFVLGLEPAGVAWCNTGSVDSAGDGAHMGPVARAVLGTDGTGVTIGVISNGVDHQAGSIASGDLPADVGQPPIAGLSPGHGDEGTAMLEIVHDLAPGGHLLFASVRTSVEMVVAIAGLSAAGARVMVDDLVFTDEPKFEDGPIALAARQFVADGGVYVTAAGNYARSHYLATYRPTGGETLAGVGYRALHAFAPGDVGNSFRIPAGAELLAVLQWSDRFGQAGDDFDLVLAHPAAGGDVVLKASTDTQDGSGNPFEALRYVNRGNGPLDAYLTVAEFARVSDPASLRLNLMVFSDRSIPLEYDVRRESILGHAAVEEVVSVAAAAVTTPGVVESFSSNGPATILYPAHEIRQVPRLTAVDGVETAVGRQGVFPNPFQGTSAAAPHVAGCAALLLAGGVSPTTAVSAMLTTAIDLAPAGFDGVSGAGFLDCAAAARLGTGQATAPVIDGVQAAFDANAAVVVQASGEDAEGDVRSAVVRVLDRHGGELGSQTLTVATDGSRFSVDATLDTAALARARSASVQATDATRFVSLEVQTAFGCPEDGSLGDALCAIGDLLEALAPAPGRSARRIENICRRAAAAVARAGDARASGRSRARRHAIRMAMARLGAVMRRARGLPSDLADAVRGQAETIRAQLLAQR